MISFDNILLVSSALVAGILNIIGFLLSFSYAKKRKNRIVCLFSANWLLQAFFWGFDAFSHLYYSTLLMAIAIIPQIIGVPCLFIFIDLIKREHVSSIRISILFIIEIILLILTFSPGGMQVIPGYGVHNIGALRIFQIIFLIYYVLTYFIWSFQTWKRAPNELKKLVNFLLFGSVLFSFVTASLYFLGTFVKLFNSLGFITHSLGALFTIIVIWKEPKIIFILPFKAYRLLVVETNAGIGLFKYDWAKLRAVDENVFTMVLQAVGSILDEILKKGEIQEIKMDRAVLLIQHNKDYPVASVLVTTKSTKSLRYGLKKFNSQFIDKFKPHFGGLYEVSKFKQAKVLVNEFFDFVPTYLDNNQ